MALLSKLFGCFSFFLSSQSSDGKGCSSIQEEPIQRPPEDTDIKEEMDSEACLVELEISSDFSSAAEPLMVPLEETESQSPHGVEIFPRSCTVAKPSLIRVAPLRSLPDEVKKSPCSNTEGAELLVQEAHAEEEILPFVSTVVEPLMAQFEDPEKELPSFFTEVAEPLMDQEARWHLTPPSEEENSFRAVAETLMVQMARAELEQERPPERRTRRRRKKESQTYSYTIKLAGASPPATPKHAWIDVSPAEDTKAEGDMIQEEREFEDVSTVELQSFFTEVAEPLMVQEARWHLTPPSEEENSFRAVAETLMVQMARAELEQERPPERRSRRRRKKESQTYSYTIKLAGASPPATPKHAWIDVSPPEDTKAEGDMIQEEREFEDETPRKTEQAADITPAKGEKTHIEELESSSKISQKSSRKQNALLLVYKMLEKKVTAVREKRKIRREEKTQRQLLFDRYANDPSMKHLLINKHKSCGCATRPFTMENI